MFHSDSDKNRFGYYQCGDFRSYSKFQAIEHSNTTGIKPQWVFNHDAYQSFAWDQEPQDDLWELYTQRAREIRNSYDYIVLMFSGGADSSNVLDVFLRNNIAVDELCSYHQLSGSKSIDNYMDSEVFKVAYPRAQEILKSFPDIRHRMIDWSQLVQDLLEDPREIQDFVYTQNKFLTPSNICRPHLRRHVADWNDIIDRGGRLCLVWGAHKPAIKAQDNGRNSYVYHDSNDFLVPVRIQNENSPDYHDELFYNPGNSPVIACKQSHLIKKSCQENPGRMLIDESVRHTMSQRQWLQRTNGNIWVGDKKWFLDREAVHAVVYPYWDTTTYTDGKPSSWIKNPRDNWLFNSGNPQVDALDREIRSAFERIGARWWKDPTDYTKGIPSFTNHYEFD